MATLPPILAGPLVRRVEPEAVHFWLATSRRFAVRAELFKLGEDRSQRIVTLGDPRLRKKALVGEARRPNQVTTVQLGQRLFVTLLRAVPKGKPFPTDELLFFDIFLDEKSLAEFGLFEPPADTAALLSPPADSILYPGAPLPSFFIASELRHLLHGSCHKLHGEGADAFAYADQRLRETSEKPLERPALLFLTGDQIYADDVADDAIERIAELGEQLLGVDERLPGVNSLRALRPGERGRLVTDPQICGFTSEEARNHLLGFGEFAALHILSWSPALWPALPPPQRTLMNPRASESDARSRLRGASEVAARVRRALANVPTYMMFDDHDVTDDWNLDPGWRARVEKAPLGRRVVANALAAYWAFQGWGNHPADFPPRFRGSLEKHLTGGARAATATAFENTLWGHTQWSFATPTRPVALALDVRTQRTRVPVRGVPPEPMDHQQGYKTAGLALKAARYQRGTPLLVVSPLPVLGLEPAENLQRSELARNSTAAVDFEGWLQSRTGRPRLLRFLQSQVTRSLCIILSGDVHYAFAANGWFSDTGHEALAVLQLTSSSLKNEDGRARDAEDFNRSGAVKHKLGEVKTGVDLSVDGLLEMGWEWSTQRPQSRGLDALQNTLQQLRQQLANLPAGDRGRGDIEAKIQETQREIRRFEGLLAQRPVILTTTRDQNALDIVQDATWQLAYRFEPFADGNVIAAATNMGRVELQLPARVIHHLAIADGNAFRIDRQVLSAKPDPQVPRVR